MPAKYAYGIIDIVTRKWIATILGPEATSTQAKVLFLTALDAEGLLTDELRVTSSMRTSHLMAITDPAVLAAELERVRVHYDTVRLHESIGYVTPDDEHKGRGDATRRAAPPGPRPGRPGPRSTSANHDPGQRAPPDADSRPRAQGRVTYGTDLE